MRIKEEEGWTQWFKEFGFSTILRLYLTYPKLGFLITHNLINKITQEFYGSLLQPYKQEFSRLTLKSKPKCFDGQTLKSILLRNIPHFPSNLSQELDEDEVLFLSYNQLSQEL